MQRKTILAFDIGLKRTGVAIGQTLTNTTQTAGQLLVSNGQFNWPQVDELLAQWQPNEIVIGNPKTDDPHLNKVINRFKSHIQQNHKLPIIEIDEAFSSVAANAELQGQRLTTQKKVLLRDQVAACLILESYFNSLSLSSDDI